MPSYNINPQSALNMYKQYDVTDFIKVLNKSDTDKNGRLTNKELSLYMQKFTGQITSSTNLTELAVVNIMFNNFGSIASGSVASDRNVDLTSKYKTSIEKSDILALANLSGDASVISISDVSKLHNGNVYGWLTHTDDIIQKYNLNVSIKNPIADNPNRPSIDNSNTYLPNTLQ